MSEPLILDASPLGQLANPKIHSDLSEWFIRVFKARVPVLLSEVADYEVRRNLLLEKRHLSIKRLDELARSLVYVPITTDHMRHAAELWADSRRRGKPTSDPKELDCDVILAAQAIELGAIVVTDNIGHLARFVPADHWRNIRV